MKVCFVDVLGLPYDGDTLKHRGLGGSESSVIRMSRELVKQGFEVDVYCNLNDDDVSPGVYDGVTYYNLDNIQGKVYDIGISSRAVAPFRADNPFGEMLANCRWRVLWMHDTFIDGELELEHMLQVGAINEVFTLSDFHTSYVTTCNHGKRRNFEVLKNKIWQTRNGVDPYYDFVDVQAKDPNLWVFNASYTKGMRPTVQEIWPAIKNNKNNLIVIGGFYRFPGREADQQEQDWRELKDQNNDPSITFTGVIPQHEIAKILAKSSYFLAPGEFPETSGISTLEALAYNVPVVASRFGALEESAVAGASYLLDYAIKPNVLFQDIDAQNQLNKYVDLARYARDDRYLWQQKANYCNIVKPLLPWRTIALQWKQHFYRVLDKYLPREEYQVVKEINYRVHKVFNRRFSNPEDYQ